MAAKAKAPNPKQKRGEPSAKASKSSQPVSSRSSPERSRRAANGPAVRAHLSPQPVASRPVVPPGYRFPTSLKGLLDWSWARERLTGSQNYIIVTVRPEGRPHAMGMHGLWFEDAYYFGTDSASRKAKNLQQNPHCIVINDKLDELLIVEGKWLSWLISKIYRTSCQTPVRKSTVGQWNHIRAAMFIV